MSKPNYLKLATDAGDQFLSTLAEGQENFLKSLSSLTTPPAAPPAAMPSFTAALPTFQEVADANFAFAQKLMKQQKEFIDKLMTATTPVSH
jgi:hypothetical protein